MSMNLKQALQELVLLYLAHRRIQAKNVEDDQNLGEFDDVPDFPIIPDLFFIVPDLFFIVQNLNARNYFGFDLQRLRTQSDSVVQKTESKMTDNTIVTVQNLQVQLRYGSFSQS